MVETPEINGKKLLLNIMKFSAAPIISALLSLMAIPVITRLFTPEEYGKINMFFSVGNMMMCLVLLGLDSAYIRFFNEPPKNTNKNQLFIFSISIGFLVNTIITLLVLMISPNYISNLIFGENNISALILLSIYIFTLIIFRQLNITYRMEQNAKEFTIQNIAQVFINRILFISVALILPTFYNAILVITGGMLMLSVVYIWKKKELFKPVYPTMKRTDISEIFRFSIPLMPTTLIVLLNDSTAKLMLGGLGKFNDIGILAMATMLAGIFAIIPSGFGIFWSSFMYSNYKTQQVIIKKMHSYVSLLCILLVLIIISLQDVLFLILGNDYKGAQILFAMIMLNPIQALLNETTAYGINISKKTKYSMLITVLAYIFNLTICYLLIPTMGGMGAAIAIAASSVIILVFKTLIGQHFYRSIESTFKTSFAFLIIICLCVGNTFYYDQFLLREGICIIVLLLSVVIYMNEIMYLKNSMFEIINKFKSKKLF